MAALAEHLSSSVSSAATAMEFMGKLQRIPEVMLIGLSRGVDVWHLWVLLREENESAMRQVFAAEREFLAATGPIPMDFHYFSVPERNAEGLPEMTVVFERG